MRVSTTGGRLPARCHHLATTLGAVDDADPTGSEPGDPVELTVVTLGFDARSADDGSAERLLGVLAKYVVLSRWHQGCRNIDLCASRTDPGRFLVIEKWETPAAQRAHFDSPEMVEMATACRDLVARRPIIDLLGGISAHDLA
ncbi:MAG: antibiotic biosynthesis monooxygenase [Actinobacteria bacterium]|nr:MAG: antibiotic biosynthesis monooxygenase [Actinomycetota bacterium]